jgi:hypothetical protein
VPNVVQAQPLQDNVFLTQGRQGKQEPSDQPPSCTEQADVLVSASESKSSINREIQKDADVAPKQPSSHSESSASPNSVGIPISNIVSSYTEHLPRAEMQTISQISQYHTTNTKNGNQLIIDLI